MSLKAASTARCALPIPASSRRSQGILDRYTRPGARHFLVGRGTRLELAITEHVAQCPRSHANRGTERANDTSTPRDTKVPYPNIPEFDWTPSGRLHTIAVGGYPRRCWNDTNRTPLERRWGQTSSRASLPWLKRRASARESRRRQQHRDELGTLRSSRKLRNDEREQYRALTGKPLHFAAPTTCELTSLRLNGS